MSNGSYWLHTLGCPKNEVDSAKLAGLLGSDGLVPAAAPQDADLIVVNTCAFIDAAREESVDAILELAELRSKGSRLVVTGCMAERYPDELSEALPEVDLVAGFGAALYPPHAPAPSAARVPITLSRSHRPEHPADEHPADEHPASSFDLLELPRPPTGSPWAYVKVAEGCDRICGFCAIPSFRGRQRSRDATDILGEVRTLLGGVGGVGAKEIVLVAQDLASYGRDRSTPGRRPAGSGLPIATLTRQVAEMAARTRLLYLYPSMLTDELVTAILSTGVPYFDLSLQHVSRPLLAGMRRWGDGARFIRRIADIRRAEPSATFRSSFILGYPGETEEDHDELLAFLAEAQLDWAGFFVFSPESGTHAVSLGTQVPATLALERLKECSELQDAITAERRRSMVGRRLEVLVDAPGRARTVHEAPEIDGVVHVPDELSTGMLAEVEITGSFGTDLEAVPVGSDVAGVSSLLAGAGPLR